jgi:hypothetical protein
MLFTSARAAAALLFAPAIAESQQPEAQQSEPLTANGGTEPYPIPWLDKNGSHNQPAGANLEPSHIYHFKGVVARCSRFTGMGTDNHGNRIAFGSPTTDYGLMDGEYWAARSVRHGTFTHIYDSRYFRDRRSLPTRSTIFIRLSLPPDSIGSCPYPGVLSTSGVTERPLCLG